MVGGGTDVVKRASGHGRRGAAGLQGKDDGAEGRIQEPRRYRVLHRDHSDAAGDHGIETPPGSVERPGRRRPQHRGQLDREPGLWSRYVARLHKGQSACIG
ncbi:unnamed protein product, partial [Ectocarpus sp. 12 AP-2014]